MLLTGCQQNTPASSPVTTVATPAPSEDLNNEDQEGIGTVNLPESIRFTRIGLEDGLSQSTVLAITQDSQGFMWFATQDGLNRYDGYEFKVFKPDPADPDSLSNTYVTALTADNEGNIWVGTRQGGLNFYDSRTGKFRHFLHDEIDSTSLADNEVMVIFIDRLQRVWVGTHSGFDLYDPTRGGFTHYLLVPAEQANVTDNIVFEIVEDDQGFLWVGSQTSGLFRFTPETGEFVKYQRDENDSSSISSNMVSDIELSEDGKLWLATGNGIDRLDPVTGKFEHFQHSDLDQKTVASNDVDDVLVDGSGILWAGTADGVDRYDPIREAFIHYPNDPGDSESLSTNIVYSLYESSDGVIWVGTFGGALNKYDLRMDYFRNFKHDKDKPSSLSGNIVFKIAIDAEQYAWIGTIDGGVTRLDPATGEVISFTHDGQNPGSLISNEVWSVFKDSRGILWVGTRSGLDQLNPGSEQFVHFSRDASLGGKAMPGVVYDIAEDKYGVVWFGNGLGLYRYDRENNSFTSFKHDSTDEGSISTSGVIKVYFDQAGTLWLGTYSGGLDRYDAATGKFIHYRHNPEDAGSLSSNTVLSILRDSSGRLWVGTENGLNLLDEKSGTFSHMTVNEGLPNNVVYGIVEDNSGRLWLSTNYGISCHTPADGSFMNITRADGLPGNEFNQNAYARDAAGNLYFGSVDGLTIFNPAIIRKSSFVPPIALLSVTQNGESLSTEVPPEWVDEVTVRWPYKSFEFRFTSLSFSNPAKNEYAYFLDGFDTEWVDAGNWPEGRYTNLPGGTYTLHLKGTNRDGLWNNEGRSLKVNVIPAIWQTLWFKLSSLVFVAGLGLTVYKVRTKTIQAYNRELERKVEQRTKEIERLFEKTKELAVIEERNRLARELHDSAKQKAFAALAQLGTASGILDAHPGSARTHLLEAENLVYEVIEELTFLIQEMYPLALKEKGLVTSLREYVFDWEARTDILVKMEVTGEKRVHLDVEQAFYRAIQEALSNVARHSRASIVEITLTYSEKELAAVIKDNGCGFDLKIRQAGMGLRTIRERVEALEGHVEILSKPDSGTCITLSVPLKPRQPKKGDSHD